MCLQAAAGPWAGPAGRGSSHPESPVLLCLTGEGVAGLGEPRGVWDPQGPRFSEWRCPGRSGRPRGPCLQVP